MKMVVVNILGLPYCESLMINMLLGLRIEIQRELASIPELGIKPYDVKVYGPENIICDTNGEILVNVDVVGPAQMLETNNLNSIAGKILGVMREPIFENIPRCQKITTIISPKSSSEHMVHYEENRS